MAWVIEQAPKDLTPAELLVAIMLANHTTHEGGHAYPKVETLAEEAHVSERAVQLALRSLTERGIIAVEKSATNRLPAMYEFPFFRGAKAAPQEARGAISSPLGCNQFTSRGATIAPKPLEEPLEEPLDTPPVSPSKRKVAMSDSWQPSATSVAYALEWGIPRELVPEVVEDFRAYWLERPREKRPGWDLTFKNRVRDIADQYRRRAATNGRAKDLTYYDDPEVVRVAQQVTAEQLARTGGTRR